MDENPGNREGNVNRDVDGGTDGDGDGLDDDSRSHADGGQSSDEAGEWRFSLEDIERRNGDTGDENDGGGNVAGAFTPDEEIEAGDIDVENAAFVLLGVALAVLVVVGFMNVLP